MGLFSVSEGLGLSTLTSSLSSGGDKYTEFITKPVVRGPFQITVNEKGELDSMSNVVLKSGVEGNTTIISIVPEGTLVEAGEQICVLDSSSLVDLRDKQVITVTQADANLKKARENVAIQENQNDSDLALADLQAAQARMAKDSFIEFDRQKQINEAQGEVLLAQDTLNQAREEYEFYKDQAKKGYANQQELEMKRIAVAKQENAVDVAKGKLKLLEEYTLEQEAMRLQVEAENFEREVERIKRSGIAALAGFKADLNAAELIHQKETDALEKLNNQIAACTLLAPQPGEVVYASQRSRRSEPTVIEEGASVHQNQTIIKLPDLTRMKVDARIHESKIRQVRIGQRVQIFVDARPHEVFEGTLESMSSVPVSGSWPNTDLKEYEAVVKIRGDNDGLKLKPGMTAQLSIIVENRRDVLQAPVQSIVAVGDKFYAWVLGQKGPERREIAIGASNDEAFEIKDGLSDGERLILNPRTNFSDEITQLEGKYNEDQAGMGLAPAPDEPGAETVQPSGEGGPATGGGPKPSEEGDRGPQAGGRGGFDPDAIFQRMDGNGDGKLTKDELPGRMQEGFDMMDSNGDDEISAEELKAAMQKMRGGGGGPGRSRGGDGAGE